jgi:KDEL-tailed cysteine endopeptidase
MALTAARALIFLVLLGIWACQATSRTLHEASMPERHEKWMAYYRRAYKNNAEKEMRLKLFKQNVEFIESFNNAGNRPYKLRINEFADQTNEEFRASHNGYKRSYSRPSAMTPFRYENMTEVPAKVDWRKNGAVTPVKDQGECGKAKIFHILIIPHR